MLKNKAHGSTPPSPYFKKGESLFYMLSSEGENLLNYKKEVEVSYKDGSF